MQTSGSGENMSVDDQLSVQSQSDRATGGGGGTSTAKFLPRPCTYYRNDPRNAHYIIN